MSLIEELEKNGLKLSKRAGGTYEWQDTAVRMWKDLKINGVPRPTWFKLFKTAFLKNRQGILNKTYSIVSDANAYNPELYFYKVYNTKLNEHNL